MRNYLTTNITFLILKQWKRTTIKKCLQKAYFNYTHSFPYFIILIFFLHVSLIDILSIYWLKRTEIDINNVILRTWNSDVLHFLSNKLFFWSAFSFFKLIFIQICFSFAIDKHYDRIIQLDFERKETREENWTKICQSFPNASDVYLYQPSITLSIIKLLASLDIYVLVCWPFKDPSSQQNCFVFCQSQFQFQFRIDFCVLCKRQKHKTVNWRNWIKK